MRRSPAPSCASHLAGWRRWAASADAPESLVRAPTALRWAAAAPALPEPEARAAAVAKMEPKSGPLEAVAALVEAASEAVALATVAAGPAELASAAPGWKLAAGAVVAGAAGVLSVPASAVLAPVIQGESPACWLAREPAPFAVL